MDGLLAIATAMFLATSAAGFGSVVLKALGLRERLPELERWPVSVIVGVGVLGWVMFFPAVAGVLTRPVLFGVAAAGVLCLAIVVHGHDQPQQPGRIPTAVNRVVALLAVLTAVIIAFDLIEALAPPADADSLAYHFALPKQYIAAQRVVFIPRAVDGAPPLLLHMTYTLALGLGGEAAMTVWSTIIGWLPAWLLYAVSRRFLSSAWALALAVLFLETPAVVYSGAAGHVEVKLAGFALVAAIAAADCIRLRDVRHAVLAGLAAGFFVAAKYNGLIFAGAVGLALLPQRQWLRAGIVYGITVIAVGWQWYAWTYANSGDPIFPLLYGWLGAKDGFWSPRIAEYFTAMNFQDEAPAPRDLAWLVAYPFIATFDGIPIWESARTGLGAFAIMSLPFAIGGIWQQRRQIAHHPLTTVAMIAAVFYLVWYLSGTSQRVRHLVPIYSLGLLVLGVAAATFAQRWEAAAVPLIAAVAAIAFIQFAGHVVFARSYLQYWLSGESREAFLERNLARYAPVPWINSHLSKNDRLLLTERQLVYHIEIPTYTAQNRYQYLVDLVPDDSNARRFRDELQRLGITHILLLPSLADARRGVHHVWTDDLATYTAALAEAGCAHVLKTFSTLAPTSRTVPGLATTAVSADVIEVSPRTCHF